MFLIVWVYFKFIFQIFYLNRNLASSFYLNIFQHFLKNPHRCSQLLSNIQPIFWYKRLSVRKNIWIFLFLCYYTPARSSYDWGEGYDSWQFFVHSFVSSSSVIQFKSGFFKRWGNILALKWDHTLCDQNYKII